MTVKMINSSRTAYIRAVREEFHESAVMLSSVIVSLACHLSVHPFNGNVSGSYAISRLSCLKKPSKHRSSSKCSQWMP